MIVMLLMSASLSHVSVECDSVAFAAGAVMEARQEGVPLQMVRDEAGDDEILNRLIDEAYRVDIYKRGSGIIEAFERQQKLLCEIKEKPLR